MDNFTITIGRQFGSGGREIGRRIAERFSIDYFDRKLLIEAASQTGFSADMLEKNDEKEPTWTGSSVGFAMGYAATPFYNGSGMLADSMYSAISDTIQKLAKERSCVIVGRSADYALRNHDGPLLNLFVHAPLDARVTRIMKRADKTQEKAARDLARKTDKLRAAYYNFYTDKRWGDAASYDLTLDSSKLSTDDICDIIALWFDRKYGIKIE